MEHRFLLFLLVVATATVLTLSYLFHDNRFLMVTAQMGPEKSAATVHIIGDIFYSIRQYEKGAYYFNLIMKEFPNSPKAESAHFYWITCMRFGNLVSSADMVAACNDYLTKYPQGPNAEMIRNIQDEYGRRAAMGLDMRAVSLKQGVREKKEGAGY